MNKVKKTRAKKSAAPQQPSEGQLKLVRDSLANVLSSKYMDLVHFIKSLPIHQAAFSQAFLFLDTGILWAEKALDSGEFVAPHDAVGVKKTRKPRTPKDKKVKK